MHADRLRQPLRRLRRALAPADGGALPDGQLLARFVADRDEAAFAALVRRHGPMVLGVCRRLVRHAQDAEDCFQAAFLVLAQRAGSVRSGSLASWLYGVAYRVALRCRRTAARRCGREKQIEDMPQPEVAPPEPQDWRPLLDQELTALPEKYRAAVALCDLEGRPRKEAARRVGCPEGTLSARLARARALLAGRLSRRGVALSGGALAAALAGGAATAAVPAQLVLSTAKAAALVAAGNAAAMGSHAALLMREVQRGMLMAKLKVCAALVTVTVLLGAGGFAFKAAGQDRRGPAKSAEVRPLTELELLRKEVDILKLQVEVLQEKVRALQAGPQAGRQEAGQRPAAMGGKMGMAGMPGMPGMPAMGKMPGMGGGGPPAAGGLAGAGPGGMMRPGGAGRAPDALGQAEAALKALRQARDPEARRRATDALERAVKRLRGQPGEGPAPDQPAQR
jgi:RNA polymerase sigma factor (sigma-70 family)